MEYSETKIKELAKKSACGFAVLSQDAALAKRYTQGFAVMLNGRLGSFVSSMNGKAGDRKRKHIDRLVQILDERKTRCRIMPVADHEAIAIEFDNCRVDIGRIPGKGLHVVLRTFIYWGTYQCVSCPDDIHLSAAEEDIADLLEMFDRFVSMCNENIRNEEAAMRRQYLVSEIEMPSLRPVVKEFMEKKGIRNYTLFIGRKGRIVLEVQIVEEYWMGNDMVGLNNIEQILGIIPYLIKRPDRITEDGLGFQSFRRW